MRKYTEIAKTDGSLWKHRNYSNLEKEKYPRVETVKTETEDIFHYIDKIQIGSLEIFIDFSCNKDGKPIGFITNSYFEQKDMPVVEDTFWLQNYKKDLLNRIIVDLQKRQEEQTILR